MLAAVVPLAVLATITAADSLSGVIDRGHLAARPAVRRVHRHGDQPPRQGSAGGPSPPSPITSTTWSAGCRPCGSSGGRTPSGRGSSGSPPSTAEPRWPPSGWRSPSSLALELIATMSVALVATEIGLRLAYGDLDLRTGLLVLILAPEAYLPLRALGTQFHATADGLEAAEKVFEVLETPTEVGATWPAAEGAPRTSRDAGATRRWDESTAGGYSIRIEGVSVRHAGRADPAPSGATFTIDPGRLTVLTGPSGCGKTTLLSCLLGFTEPTTGSITPRPGPGPRSAGEVPRSAAGTFLRHSERRVAFHPVPAPWHPTCGARQMSGSRTASFPVVSARPGRRVAPAGSDACSRARWPRTSGSAGPAHPTTAVAAAARAAALDDVDPRPGPRRAGRGPVGRPAPPCRPGPRAAARRARCCCSTSRPRAWTPNARRRSIAQALRRYAASGHAVVVVSHRPALIAAADEVVDLAAQAASGERIGTETRTEVPA